MANPNPHQAWEARRDPVVQRFYKKLRTLKPGQQFTTTAPTCKTLYQRAAVLRKKTKAMSKWRLAFTQLAKHSFRVARVR